MSSDNVIPLFGRKISQEESKNVATKDKTTLVEIALRKQGHRPSISIDEDENDSVIKTDPRELVLDKNKTKVMEVLKNSVLSNLIDFSTDRFKFVINTIGLFNKDNLTSLDVELILSYNLSSPNKKISRMLLESNAFRRIAGEIEQEDYDYPGAKPVGEGEVRIEKLNKFETACYQSLRLYGKNNSPSKHLVEKLMERNIRQRISKGLDHSMSEYIDESVYNQTRIRLNNDEDVYLGARKLFFIVTKKL